MIFKNSYPLKLILLISLLTINLFLIILTYTQNADATGGAFPFTKHGGVTDNGVVRKKEDGNSVYPSTVYAPGECTQCHEPHASYGDSEVYPSSFAGYPAFMTATEADGPDPYLLFSDNNAKLCWTCHETFSFSNSYNQLGWGYYGFYQGKTVYENSTHGDPLKNTNMLWPGISGETNSIHPRKSRPSMLNSISQKGICLNCHTPHGILGSTGKLYDTDTVPETNQLKVNNPSLTADYLIPRQLIAWEEKLCMTCHDGSPAIDIKTEINKRSLGGSGHPVDDINLAGRHVVNESFPITTKHVECYDCHNPHAVKSSNKVEGLRYVDVSGVARDPAMGDSQPYVYQICLKCHGDGYANFIPARTHPGPGVQSNNPLRTTAGNPASSNTNGSNKRLEFNTSSTGSQSSSDFNPSPSQNTAYHPVASAGRNTSLALQRQLLGGLTPDKTINCTDCHNTEATGSTQGTVTKSNTTRASDLSSGYTGVSPVGPHGSKPALVDGYQTYRILRANYNTTLGRWDGIKWKEPFDSYNRDNFALCFLCHNEDAFTKQCGSPYNECGSWTDGSKTNFYSTAYDINLHASHIAKKPVFADYGTSTTCANCHYNVHSNIEAANTMYEDSSDAYWNKTSDGSRLINFSPIVGPSTRWTYTRPFWGCVDWYGKRKGCDFNCHGFDQELYYTSPNITDSCP